MKTIRLSVLLVSVLWLGQMMAQPILNNHEKFVPYQEAAFFVMDTTNATEGQGGENVIWDFTGFTATASTYKKTYLPVSQTEKADSFTTASLAQEGTDGITHYFKEKNDTLSILGSWIKDESILITYQNPMVQTIRPLQYPKNLSLSTNYTYKFVGFNYKGGGNYTINADGYGTLKLGSGTYTNVLRVKFDADFYDTLQGVGTVQHIRTTAYTWYNLYTSAPLVEMKTTIITSPQFNSYNRSVHVLKNPSTFTHQPNEEKNDLTVWYTENKLIVKGLSTSATHNIQLYDITGKRIPLNIIHSDETETQLSITNPVSPGVYAVVVNEGATVKTQKIIIQ